MLSGALDELIDTTKLVPTQRFLLVRRIRREGWWVTQAFNEAVTPFLGRLDIQCLV
jgi:hypothetical protein